MACDRRTVRLGDVCECVLDGDWVETKDQGGSDYRLLQISNIGVGVFRETGKYRYVSQAVFERLRCTELRLGDVLVARMPEPTGRAWCIDSLDQPCITAVDVAIVRTLPDTVDPRFLAYILNSPAMLAKVSSLTTGTTRMRIRRRDIEDLQVTIPGLSEQRAVVSVLRALDDKIELNRGMGLTLDGLAESLFSLRFEQYWGTARESAEAMPSGWSTGTVEDLGRVVTGGTPSTKEACNYGSDVPFVTIPDMRSGIFVTSTAKALSQVGADSQRTRYVPAGSVCVSCIATPGLVAMTSERSQTNQQINTVIPAEDVDRYYAFYALRRIGRSIAGLGSGGSVYANLSKSRFAAIPVLLPSAQAMGDFGRIVDPLFRRALVSANQSRFLASIRDVLLPRLLSGELSAVEAEKAVEEVV